MIDSVCACVYVRVMYKSNQKTFIEMNIIYKAKHTNALSNAVLLLMV